ncbi:2418_t:CDS:2 [Ambispora leptoticha]|uniref:2418_t:CDS:1 n=1 Tax=Ambispora leptoticha TaxID=144679 RepID=A0A9N8W2E1_9GLOM|nr:2418_t:CDS:2 [Ambispora leptoticha]
MSFLPEDNVSFPGCILRVAGMPPTPEFGVMDSFYARLNSLKFATSQLATGTCRQLAREYGFTVKQETSANKASLSDSKKTGKQTKRKRSSLRCDCKWRIVLFQNEEDRLWEFRKSQNPQSSEHNHELSPPEHIPLPWPPRVVERIAYHASLGLATNEIRIAVQQEFPNILWDERRFYNRLSEERRKIKARETETRVIETMAMAARVAALVCSSKEYTEKVHQALDTVILQAASTESTSSLSCDPTLYPPMSLPSTSSTLDLLCGYPAGTILVKNIPSQKGRPSKKNQQQSQKLNDASLLKFENMRNTEVSNAENFSGIERESYENVAPSFENSVKDKESLIDIGESRVLENNNVLALQEQASSFENDSSSQSTVSLPSPIMVENMVEYENQTEDNAPRYQSMTTDPSIPVKYEYQINDQRNSVNNFTPSERIPSSNDVNCISTNYHSGLNVLAGATSLLPTNFEQQGMLSSTASNGNTSLYCQIPANRMMNHQNSVMMNANHRFNNSLSLSQPIPSWTNYKHSVIGSNVTIDSTQKNNRSTMALSLISNGSHLLADNTMSGHIDHNKTRLSQKSPLLASIETVKSSCASKFRDANDHRIGYLESTSPVGLNSFDDHNSSSIPIVKGSLSPDNNPAMSDQKLPCNACSSSVNSNASIDENFLPSEVESINCDTSLHDQQQNENTNISNTPTFGANQIPNGSQSINTGGPQLSETHCWNGPTSMGGIPSPPSLSDMPPLAGMQTLAGNSVTIKPADPCHWNFAYNAMPSRMITHQPSQSVPQISLPVSAQVSSNHQYHNYTQLHTQNTWYQNNANH